ncbi:uncharacterized protein [Heptranchias perlo]|uniref:uncharacterized protein isoform X2 n=1 Tax=Heptranchias perlo TaxID=212740 RepID=UPI00355A5C15
MCTWKMLIIQRIAFMHLILFVLCTESQSVTLSCALDSEGKGSLFNITKWTRGLSTGENRDKSPSYKDHLQKVAQEAFGKDEIFIKIFGFMARDSVTYYCQVAEKRQRVTNGTTLEVRCSTMETKDAGTDITPVLLVALALIAVLIIFLTFRLMWRNKSISPAWRCSGAVTALLPVDYKARGKEE